MTMDKAKKKLASALDGFRFNHSKMDIAVDERILPEHCRLTKVVRHGFPDDPRCITYDPVQRLLAIGTAHGSVRMIGEQGVDYLLQHESDHAVNHLQFLVNEGGLVTACGNDMIHLWNFRQKTPEVVHSMQLNKESVTAIHLPIGSKWLYVGTDKGNVYFVSVATFSLSSYVINWNKAIDLSCRVHPGPVRQLSACPTDPSKLLIAFDKGVVVQWCLSSKEVDRFPLDPPIKSVSWHFDGKQVMTGNVDGSVCVYNIKKTSEPVQKSTPHGQGVCRPIPLIDWKHTNENEQLVIFSGGMPTDDGLPVPALTILRAARSATVMEMEHPIISFVTLCQQPYNSVPQQPHAVAVLLKNDLMLIDLQTANYPCIESPHAMDIHESPITCVQYYSDCPSDLIGALTLVGCKQRKKGFSDRPWPLSGGVGRECATGHQELIITGHKDGSLRFWQASGEHLQILYRLKTGSHFERLEEFENSEKVSHAVKGIELCLESRLLLVTGVSGQVSLFRFSKSESSNSIAVVHIPLMNSPKDTASLDERLSTSAPKEMRRQRKVISRDSTHSPDTSDASGDERIVPFKVRGAPVKRLPGYQPELACLVPWPSASSSDCVTCTTLNSSYGVIALGTTSGLALVDIAQCALIYAWNSSELYGSDPTPAIQLHSQLSDASSPMEEDTVAPSNGHLSVESLVSPKNSTKRSGVVNIIRRNTAELKASWREKYGGHSPQPDKTDRPEVPDHRSPSPGPEASGDRQLTGRSHSVKGSIMRKLTKKGNNIARSLSFHSHISEEKTFVVFQSPGYLSDRSGSGFPKFSESLKQRSFDRRPLLFKAQSVMETVNGSPRGETPRDSPSLGRANHSSPSNSTNSLERIGVPNESVTSLQFIQSSSKRNDPKTSPCLWVGTSVGTTIALNLILPQDRLISTVVVAPSGTVVKLKGQVLTHAFMDQFFCLVGPSAESYKETSRESNDSGSPERSTANKVLTKPSLSPVYSNSIDCSDEISQVLIVASEQEVKVIALPSFSQLFCYKCDDVPLVKAFATHIRGYPVLMCLTAAGTVLVLSLPSLRPMLNSPLLPRSIDIEDPMCHRTAFSEHGLGVYMASPSELEKYTVCSELADQSAEAMGELFVACEMPETPKNTSFLKGVSSIFGGTPRPTDGTDVDLILTGDKDKNAPGATPSSMRSVGRTIPGPSASMDRGHAGGVSAGQAAQMAMQNLAERGERLNMVIDATENLKNSAMNMASRSNKLVEKFEKKKWYNF